MPTPDGPGIKKPCFVDDDIAGVERDNPVLNDVLPKDYVPRALDKQRLGQLIDMAGNIPVGD